MIFRTNKNKGQYFITNTCRAKDHYFVFTSTCYIKSPADENLAKEQGAFSMNQVGFSSELLRLPSHQCSQTSHSVPPGISLSPPSLENFKTKQTWNNSNPPTWKSTVTQFETHTFVNSAYTVLWGIKRILSNSEPERSGSEVRTQPAPATDNHGPPL